MALKFGGPLLFVGWGVQGPSHQTSQHVQCANKNPVQSSGCGYSLLKVQTDLTSLIDQAVSKYRKVENYEGCVGKIIRQNLNEVNFPQTASTYSP